MNMFLPTLAVVSASGLLLLALASVVGLVVLIARFKCNAFIALMLASLAVGLGSGMPLMTIPAHPDPQLPGAMVAEVPGVIAAFEAGVGRTLGFLAMIIGLGTILGKLLAESGAAGVISATLIRALGRNRLDVAVMLIAFIIGISVFFGVGLILLAPIVFTLARETRTPILRLALPLVGGLSTAHGLIPPHPGPMAAINVLGANTGMTIFWSILIGFPVAFVTGPLLARRLSPLVPLEMGGLGAAASSVGTAPRQPGFAVSIFTMLLPVILMLIATLADVTLTKENAFRHVADFVGAPSTAMLVAVLVAFWTFGRAVGLSADRVLKFTEECVGPAASILLVVGAGGGFSMVLNASGVGQAIADLAGRLPVSPIFLGWLIAALLRIAVGSATVAVTMAAGLIAPLVANQPEVNRELLVVAMGAGSIIFSHVNDGGFWFVKEYFGMTMVQTLKTWSLMETAIAIVSLLFVLLLDLFV